MLNALHQQCKVCLKAGLIFDFLVKPVPGSDSELLTKFVLEI